LLKGAAGIAATAAAGLMPPNVQRALAQGQTRNGSLRDIKHVVILMQENRARPSASLPATFVIFGGTQSRICFPPIGHTRRIVPAFGFGPFQNGSRKNSRPFRTASWDEPASTFVAYCPPGPEM
jgi:hypothetical protein